jgi:hypothetical protein
MKGLVLHPLIWIVEEKQSVSEPLMVLHVEVAGNSLVSVCYSPASRALWLVDEGGENVGWVPLQSLVKYALNAGLKSVEPHRWPKPNVAEVGHA